MTHTLVERYSIRPPLQAADLSLLQPSSNDIASVRAFACRKLTDNPSLLVCRRLGSARNERGKLEFPGGSTKTGESMSDTAVRETREETKIGLQVFDSAWCRVRPLREDASRKYFAGVVTAIALRGTIIPDSNEVAWAGFMPLSEILKRLPEFRSDTPALIGKVATMGNGFGEIVTIAHRRAGCSFLDAA